MCPPRSERIRAKFLNKQVNGCQALCAALWAVFTVALGVAAHVVVAIESIDTWRHSLLCAIAVVFRPCTWSWLLSRQRACKDRRRISCVVGYMLVTIQLLLRCRTHASEMSYNFTPSLELNHSSTRLSIRISENGNCRHYFSLSSCCINLNNIIRGFPIPDLQLVRPASSAGHR